MQDPSLVSPRFGFFKPRGKKLKRGKKKKPNPQTNPKIGDGFMASPKLSADEGTVASLISLATFLPAGRQRRGGRGCRRAPLARPQADRARCPPPGTPRTGARRVRESFFFFFLLLFFFLFFLLLGPFYLCPSLQVVVLASNWAVVDMLMRRLGGG